jgi:hypothetical protein
MRTDTTRKTTKAVTMGKRYPVVTQDTFPLETALRNVGYKLLDNIRYVPGKPEEHGRHEKRGSVWMPLSKGKRLMPEWCDNPAEWRMLCDRYGAGSISRCGRYADIANGDGTYRFERIV